LVVARVLSRRRRQLGCLCKGGYVPFGY
jgi:hypothetical protein